MGMSKNNKKLKIRVHNLECINSDSIVPVNITINCSFWDAIKIRIAGMQNLIYTIFRR